jgi:hypothetical protein
LLPSDQRWAGIRADARLILLLFLTRTHNQVALRASTASAAG